METLLTLNKDQVLFFVPTSVCLSKMLSCSGPVARRYWTQCSKGNHKLLLMNYVKYTDIRMTSKS